MSERTIEVGCAEDGDRLLVPVSSTGPEPEKIPEIAMVGAVVFVLEKMCEQLRASIAENHRLEHVAALGHLKSALTYERDLFHEYDIKNRAIAVGLQRASIPEDERRQMAIRRLLAAGHKAKDVGVA